VSQGLGPPGSPPGRATLVDPCSDARWAAYVEAEPGALVFHHPAWLRALQRGYGFEPVGLLLEEGGRVQGVLPLVLRPGLATGRRLMSLPQATVAGPLGRSPAVRAALAQAALGYARTVRAGRVELKLAPGAEVPDVRGLTAETWSTTYVLDLPGDPGELEVVRSREAAAVRRAVKKARKSGARLRDASSAEDVRAWYRLYLETMRDHAVPPRAWAFVLALWELLAPLGLMRLLLVEHEVAGRTRLAAGSLFLMHGSTVFFAYNGRRREDLHVRPNELAHWQMIHDACAAGYTHYDMGEVGPAQHGLAAFKEKWGAQRRELRRLVSRPHAAAPARARAGAVADGRVRELGEHAWRRLPLPVTERLGGWVYRRL